MKFKLILLSLVTILSSCSYENVNEGTKGVLIKRPYIFGSDGTEILEPGRHVIAASSTLVPADIKPTRIKEEFDDLNTKDNAPVDFDIYFTIQNISSEVNVLYSKFGLDYYEKNLQQEFRNLTRDKCKQYEMNPLTNDVKVSEDINAYVLDEGNKIIKKLSLPVILLAVNMGAVNPSKEVTEERAKTAAAKQREQTIAQQTKNEIGRQASEHERAKADKAYQEAMGLNTGQYIQLQALKVKEIGYSKATTVTIVEGDLGLTKITQ